MVAAFFGIGCKVSFPRWVSSVLRGRREVHRGERYGLLFIPRLRCAYLGLLGYGIFDTTMQQVTCICIQGCHVVAAGCKPAQNTARGKARGTSADTPG